MVTSGLQVAFLIVRKKRFKQKFSHSSVAVTFNNIWQLFPCHHVLMKTVDDGGHLDSIQAEEMSVSRVRIQDQLVVLDPNRGSSEGPAAREKMSDKTHKD